MKKMLEKLKVLCNVVCGISGVSTGGGGGGKLEVIS